MPCAGRPWAVSKTWVEIRAMLSTDRQTQNSEWRPGIGIDSFGDRIPGTIVGLQIHLSNGRDLFEYFRAHLINHFLNAAGLESVEHIDHDAAYGGRNGSVTECLPGVQITPRKIEPHVQRPVFQIGKGGVFVANKSVERAPPEAQQTESVDSGARFDQPIRSHFEARKRTLWTGRGHGFFPRGAIRNLRRRDLQAFGVRIFREKLLSQEAAILLQPGALKVERFALDEVLHRVRRDQARVIAGRVGRPERVAIDQQRHVDGEHGVAGGIQAVDGDVAFPVIVSFPTARKAGFVHDSFSSTNVSRRKPAIRYTCVRASASSDSGSATARLFRASMISRLPLPFTAKRNGNPNLARYARLDAVSSANSSGVS